MLRKFRLLFVFFVFLFSLTACKVRPVLRILNWGEYISLDLVKRFEREANCKVKVLQATSNEMMHINIINMRSNYDIAVPSDYMIEKFMRQDLIYKLDFTRLTNYKEGYIVPDLDAILNQTNYKEYFIPYFWGALGIMYNKRIPGLEELVKEHGYGVFYKKDIRSNYKVGMLDTSRDSFGTALLYLNKDLNTTLKSDLVAARDIIKEMDFDTWLTDSLKTEVATGNLDYAVVYSGDYFDMLSSDLDGNPSNVKNYGIYCPTLANNIFCDGLVIPKSSRNIDLAYKFLDFMLNPDNMLENVMHIGYSPTFEEVKNAVFKDPNMKPFWSVDAYYPLCDKPQLYRDLDEEYYALLEKLYISING